MYSKQRLERYLTMQLQLETTLKNKVTMNSRNQLKSYLMNQLPWQQRQLTEKQDQNG